MVDRVLLAPGDLSDLQRAIVTPPGLARRDFALALRSVRQTIAITGDRHPDFIFEVAKALYASGARAEPRA